jgi:hypothetical protein
MKIRSMALTGLAVAAIGITGCATTPHAQETSMFDAPADRGASVRVSNNNWSDMTVYVVRSGMRVRLGQVPSMSTRELRIPAGVLTSASPMQLMARPLASRSAYVSHNLSIVPGQRVNLSLENNLNLSTFTIR